MLCCTDICWQQWLLFHHFELPRFTLFLVQQQPIGSPEVNRVPDGHTVQILRHLPPFRVGGVGVLVINLEAHKLVTIVTQQDEEDLIHILKSPLLSLLHIYFSCLLLFLAGRETINFELLDVIACSLFL